MEPSWKDAPEWANWLAQDWDGAWHWYKTRPELKYDSVWCDPAGWCLRAGFGPVARGNADLWRNSLEARP